MSPSNSRFPIFVAFVAAGIGLVLFVGFGGFIVWKGWNALQNGNHSGGTAGLIFGLIFIAVAVVPFIKLWGQVRRPKHATSDPKPWLARPDWATGKIKSSSSAQTRVYFIMGLGFCGIGGTSAFLAITQELPKGNYLALVILIFPIVGVGFLAAVLRNMLAQKRYGDCVYEMTTIPGALGGTLEGTIQVGARLRLEHGLHLTISCLRRTVSGSGKSRSVQESVLWQDEKVFGTHVDLPESEPGRSGIPVYFELPANQPECFSSGNETILWRLEARTQMSGPDFSVGFDVPVFRVAEAGLASNKTDPTAALQMSIEEIRRDENSKIKITDGLHGREYFFPAARNPIAAINLTVFFLIWTGVTLAGYRMFKSLPFEIIFTVVDVLIFAGCVNFWFKSSRVTIDALGIKVTNRWLFVSRTRTFAIENIGALETKNGMTSGRQAYHNIQLNLQGNKKATLATGIASKPEADWLVKEMTSRLK